MYEIGFITEANEKIGFGHLYRSIALAEAFVGKGFSVVFFLENETEKETLKQLLPNTLIFEKSGTKEYLNNHPEKFAHLIIDVYHNHLKEYSYLEELEKPVTTIIIDAAFSEKSLNTDLVFKIGFQDYQHKLEIIQTKDGRVSKHFSGNDFFIFRKEFEKDFHYKCRQNADRVLVTMGGSDPYQLTELVAKGLELIVKPLQITYVLGKGFSEKRFNELKRTHQQTIHNITYGQGISNMAETMAAKDIAIINGGNTRFELAKIGVPFLSVSIHKNQQTISERIEKKGIGKPIGIGFELQPQEIADEIKRFLNDHTEREKMSLQMKNSFNIIKENQKVREILNEKN